MAVAILSMQRLEFADATYYPDAFRYWLCDTDAEVTALGSGKAHEGDLAYSKEAHMLYFRTNTGWTAVA